jgi:hypothetical protein
MRTSAFANGQTWDLPVPAQGASTHARFFDPAGPPSLAISCLAVLPSAFETASAPGNSDFVAQWLRIPMMADSDSDRSRTAFRSMADRIPTHRGQRSDDRGQLLPSTPSLGHEAGLASMAVGLGARREAVPVVHRGDPRAPPRALIADAAARAGSTCGPTGAAGTLGHRGHRRAPFAGLEGDA